MIMLLDSIPQTPRAFLTLRAHRPSPARVELTVRPRLRRFVTTCAWLALCWGSIPLLLWIPPHYPWVALAFLIGAYLAFRNWTGRYKVHSFAGICPRCGAGISMSGERKLDLPHTLTCFHCHFEPRLEIQFEEPEKDLVPPLEHQSEHCVGMWEVRWLADEQFLYCSYCHGGARADDALVEKAEAENAAARLLMRLSNEGRPLI